MSLAEAAAHLKAHPDSVVARNDVAALVVRVATDAVGRFANVPSQERPQIANGVAHVVTEAIRAGRVEPGNEQAYARTTARHHAINWLRRRRERPVDQEVLDSVEEPTRDLDDELDGAARVEVLRAVLADETALSARHRRILREVYFEHVEPDRLVDAELAQRIAAGKCRGTAADRERARNKIDADLSRARKALAAVMVERLHRGGGHR